MQNHIYIGKFTEKDWYKVTIDGKPFDHKYSLKIRNHSPDGFSWGYSGSGPAQLALAMLLKETDHVRAEKYYMDFKNDIIAGFDKEGFTFTSVLISEWLDLQE